MNKLLATLTVAVMLMAPLATTVALAESTQGSLPAAVDQLLARDMIQLAQAHLKLAGFNPGRTDGVFDAWTSEAVRQYQVARALPVSGLLDEPTRRVLLPGNDEAGEE